MNQPHPGTSAFCCSTALRLSNAPAFGPPRKAFPTCAAHPPRRIASVTKDLQQALQISLKSRTSRIDVALPNGAKLGTEKRDTEESTIARRIAGDRELSRIIAGMFERTGLSVRVIFSTERERATAARIWGPLVECDIAAWEGKAASSRKNNGGGMGKQRKTAKSTKSTNLVKSGFGKIENEAVAEPDVFIIVGGGAASMARARSLAESYGMDKLIIIANGNLAEEQLPVDLQRYMHEEFECVYHYKPNPHPKWSGGVLFRKFPDGKTSFASFFDYSLFMCL